jgi:patatin-related protein
MGTERELRLALGMRGGVSLAVWIGGACAEIEELRASGGAEHNPRSTFWNRLTDWSGYSSVVVDIMAGASAGGLNGVIYAAAQVYGFDLGQLRQAWLDVGDLGEMIRTAGDDGASLLRGDSYFFTKLCGLLDQRIRDASEQAAEGGARVDLTLTTTLVEPALRGPHDKLLDVGDDERYASTLRFRHRGPGWMTDFPEDPAASPRVASQLALAARATSSFPFAFEGAKISARRRKSFSATPGDAVGLDVDMAGILGDARSDDRDFVAVDGGVLDNIPLGRAITAIAEAPADMPTRRVLVYIRPGGAGGGARPESRPDLAALRSTAGVITGIVRSRVRPETIREDLDLLFGHNRLVLRSRRLRRMVLHGVTNREELRRCAGEAYPTYRLQRAEYDAQVVRRLLEDPVTVLGEDPFPRVDGIDDGRWRAPLSYRDRHDVATFDARLADEFAQRLSDDPGSAIREGVRPITRLTRLLLDWARYLEGEDHPEAGKVKGRLYEALLIQTELAERMRRLAWVTIATCHPDRSARAALGTVDELLALSQDDVSAVLERCNGDGTASLDGLRTRLLGSLDDIAHDRPGKPPPGDYNLRDVLLGVIVDCANTLGTDEITGYRAEPPPDAPPGAWVHRAMCDGRHGTITTADLAALEIATFAEALVGAPPSGHVDFVELSSDNTTPIASAFEQLLAKDSKRPDFIPPDNKLAGNDLKNFSAFLRRHWRENDWMWGRLDAVPTLVELLVTPASLFEAATRAKTVEALLAELKALVLAVDVPNGDWASFLETDVWGPREPGIRAEAEAALALTRCADGVDRTADIERLEVGRIRDAITATRQWQVFAQDCPPERPTDAAADIAEGVTVDGLSPDRARQRAGGYRVGTETLTNPRVKREKLLLRNLTGAALRAAPYNAERTPALQAVAGATRRGARLLTWAWLDRSATFWLPVVLLLGATIALVAAAPALLTDADTAGRLWAGAAVPGVVLILAAGAAAATRRHVVTTLTLLLLGAGLSIAAWTWGDNSLGVVAVVATALLAALGAVIGLARLRP